MEKVKTIAKYVTNVMAIINALILVLDPIWGIPFADKISATLIGVAGVIGTYLLGSKVVSKELETQTEEVEEHEEEINLED